MAKNIKEYSKMVTDSTPTYVDAVLQSPQHMGLTSLLFLNPIMKDAVVTTSARDAAKNQYTKYMDEAGLSSIDLDTYANMLYNLGYLTKDEVELVPALIENYNDKRGRYNIIKTYGDIFSNKDKNVKLAKLYEKITSNIDVLESLNGLTREGIEASIISNSPVLNNIPGPSYIPVDTGDIASFPIGERRLWTGAELAELNDTNWDPEHYYNLIKQGTSTALDEARFLQAQADAASTINNTAEGASYLDALRNIKSEAISAGATRGARAAAEIIQSNEATNNFATAQRELAADSNKAIQEPLLADASARLSAREYFDSLAQDRYQQAMTYYTNDTDTVGQQILTDAELYGADLNARAQAAYANAQMNRAYTEAQAAVNAARSAVNNTNNEFLWLLDRFTEASGGNLAEGATLLNKYLTNSYTGAPDFKTFLNNNSK